MPPSYCNSMPVNSYCIAVYSLLNGKPDADCDFTRLIPFGPDSDAIRTNGPYQRSHTQNAHKYTLISIQYQCKEIVQPTVCYSHSHLIAYQPFDNGTPVYNNQVHTHMA